VSGTSAIGWTEALRTFTGPCSRPAGFPRLLSVMAPPAGPAGGPGGRTRDQVPAAGVGKEAAP
jgi:hypothetical protein